MGKSYGFIEITGVVAAINALDIMCKTADVELASWERKLGGRLVTIIVEGDVSAVTEAVNAAATGAIKKPVSYAVIARPHEEIVRMVELSASRWKNNQAAAPRRTKAKTSSKPEVKAQTADTAAETANKTESQKEQIKETVSHKEEKVMTQEALGMVETR